MLPNQRLQQGDVTTMYTSTHEDNKQRSAMPGQTSETQETYEDDQDDTSSDPSHLILPTPSPGLTPAHHYHHSPAVDPSPPTWQVLGRPPVSAGLKRSYDHAEAYNVEGFFSDMKKRRFNPSYDPHMAQRPNSISSPYQHQYHSNPRSVSLDIRTPEELAAVNASLVTLGRDVTGTVPNHHRYHPPAPTANAAPDYFDPVSLSQMGLAGLPGIPSDADFAAAAAAYNPIAPYARSRHSHSHSHSSYPPMYPPSANSNKYPYAAAANQPAPPLDTASLAGPGAGGFPHSHSSHSRLSATGHTPQFDYMHTHVSSSGSVPSGPHVSVGISASGYGTKQYRPIVPLKSAGPGTSPLLQFQGVRSLTPARGDPVNPTSTLATTQGDTRLINPSFFEDYFRFLGGCDDDGAGEGVAQSHCTPGKRAGGGEVERTSMQEYSISRVRKFFEDEPKCRKVLQMKGDKAQRWLDLLQALMDNSGYPRQTRSNIFKVMLHLSKNSGMYPECLTIKNVEKLGEHPVAGGGFGDVWKGRVAEQTVCLKVVRVFNASDLQQLVKEYMQEAIVWQQLRHPNLLPFVGMYYLSKSQGQLCLVSPWMERGNLVMYLKDTPKEQVNHYSLASDTASGLAYLHDRKIFHGDMKGVNILITPELRACIADFGLSHVADSHALKLTTSVTSRSRGTTRWLAPELLIPKPSSVTTRQSDIYAYGCVCYEIFAGRVPFYDLIDSAVLIAVYVEKQHPSRPAELDDDDLWKLLTSCWNYDPSNRPTAADLLNRVRLLQSSRIPGGESSGIESAPSWKSLDVDRIRSNVDYPSLNLGLLDSI
ncbi:hypothetical protein PM082_002138 [Marasmius tenuissimus]|nr:hypothetical protein PM082_002138 [Marasmius tenuissimus]